MFVGMFMGSYTDQIESTEKQLSAIAMPLESILTTLRYYVIYPFYRCDSFNNIFFFFWVFGALKTVLHLGLSV